MWKNENIGTKTKKKKKRQNVGTKFAFIPKYYKACGGYMKSFYLLNRKMKNYC